MTIALRGTGPNGDEKGARSDLGRHVRITTAHAYYITGDKRWSSFQDGISKSNFHSKNMKRVTFFDQKVTRFTFHSGRRKKEQDKQRGVVKL